MIRNVIFDIGGVLIDESDEVLGEYLGLSSDEIKPLIELVYGDARWHDGVMLGKLSQQIYLAELAEQYPE